MSQGTKDVGRGTYRRPGMSDLRATAAAIRERGEERGAKDEGRKRKGRIKPDPFGGREPYVDPKSLRVGVDRVVSRGTRDEGRRTREGIWCGHYLARAAVLFDGCTLPVLVDGFEVDEHEPIPSSVSFTDFRDGWHTGFEAALSSMPVSGKASNNKPTDFGRGVAAGYANAMAPCLAHFDFYAIERTYNELVRGLAITFPGEHWVGAVGGKQLAVSVGILNRQPLAANYLQNGGG